jgi:choline-glycine betaine transporter
MGARLLELLFAGSMGIAVALYAFGEPLKQAAETQAKRQRAAAAAAAAADAGRSGGAQ